MRLITTYSNALKSGFSFMYSSALHVPYMSGMPAAVGIELTNHCNLRCPECYTGAGMMTRKKGYMDIDLFTKINKELNPWLLNINLYFQGEPMMHPDFFTFIEISGHNSTTVSTNGHFLSEENCRKLTGSKLTKLIISLDGTDQKSYTAYRTGGDYNKVSAGIRLLAYLKRKYRSSPVIELQCIVNSFNEAHIPAMKEYAKELGLPLKLKSMQVYDKSRIAAWMPEEKRYRRYKVEGEEPSGRLPYRCARLWFNPVVTWDGKVVPCCFDKDAKYIMGDLREQSFREIWHGDKFREFRNMVLQKRGEIDICCNCTSGLSDISI